MTASERSDVEDFGNRAAEIATLCDLTAAGLYDDPDTAAIGEAVEGLKRLARLLSNDLLAFAEPNR